MATASERRRALRAAMQAPGIVVAPSCYDPLSAMLIAEAGFGAVHVSGSGVARSWGLADVGLTTATEMIAVHERIVGAIDIPVVGDAETGYGNALNVQRTVRAYERAGVSAIHLEDDYTPKRPGGNPDIPHGAIPVAEMVGKLKAALDARTDPDFLIIARSNARDAESFEQLMERLAAYEEAGADLIWPGVRALEELQQLPGRLHKPGVGVPPRPRVSAYQYADYGFKIACLPGTLGQAATAAMRAALQAIKQSGNGDEVFDRLPDGAAAKRWYQDIGMKDADRVEQQFGGGH
ncbi:MAG TPA: isocitrate lyase/PEP mutase family protein [Chloroflexota bacterium]|jgi:2-methylisocitrate lyase-like PEP mutase family enzyme